MIKYIFGMLVNIKAQSTQNKNFTYLCNISSKTWGMKLIFCMQINVKVFYKIIVSLWVRVARHAQSTENRNFAISLQYVKENVKDEIGFLPADQRQKFLQISSKRFYHLRCVRPVMAKLPKITSLLFCNSLRKEWVKKMIFCMQIRMKVF